MWFHIDAADHNYYSLSFFRHENKNALFEKLSFLVLVICHLEYNQLYRSYRNTARWVGFE